MIGLRTISLGIIILCFCLGNVSGQGGTVYKTVIKEGTGPVPRPNQTVVVHYIGHLENGVKIDSSYDRNEPFRFRLWADEVIRGWDAGVASMKVGERAKLEIGPEDGYGPEGMPGVIPPNSNLTFDIELLAVEDTPGVQTAPPMGFQTMPAGAQSFRPQSMPSSPSQTGFSQTFQSPGFTPPAQQSFQQFNNPNLEPNIPNLVASNSAFISQPTPQFSGMVPPGTQGVMGGASFRPSGQAVRNSPVSFNTLGVSMQQGQGQLSVPASSGGFINQQQLLQQQQQQQQQRQQQQQQQQQRQINALNRPASPAFGTVRNPAVQFPGQGGQMMSQTGAIGSGAPRFNSQSPDRTPTGFGVGGQQTQQIDPRMRMSQQFQAGGVQRQSNVRGPTPDPRELAMLRAMEERAMAARRMGLMAGASNGRGLARPMNSRGGSSFAEMMARQRMGGGGMAGPAIPPALRALIAMRRGMGPGPVPPGFPRPRISPVMARRILARRRLA